jgi:hypothetical protein
MHTRNYIMWFTQPIYLCTDASDYAKGAYLYQVRLIDDIEYHEPIRSLSKTLTGAQLRWSTIEKVRYLQLYRKILTVGREPE